MGSRISVGKVICCVVPGPLYESLPYYYLLGGVLFIAGTNYIGLSAPGVILYLGCGTVCMVAGVAVLVRRHVCRAAAHHFDQANFA